MWFFSITPQSWFNNRFSWGLKHLLVTNIRNCVFVALISWFQISDTVSARNRPTSPSAVDFVSANYKNFDPPRWAYFLHNSVLTPDFLTKITSNFGFEKFSSPKLFVTKIMSRNFGQEGPGRHGLWYTCILLNSIEWPISVWERNLTGYETTYREGLPIFKYRKLIKSLFTAKAKTEIQYSFAINYTKNFGPKSFELS